MDDDEGHTMGLLRASARRSHRTAIAVGCPRAPMAVMPCGPRISSVICMALSIHRMLPMQGLSKGTRAGPTHASSRPVLP